jgi:hypothetical protein
MSSLLNLLEEIILELRSYAGRKVAQMRPQATKHYKNKALLTVGEQMINIR